MTIPPDQPPIDPEALPALNEYDKDEWRDVYRIFKPDASEEDFDRAWEEFQVEKARRRLS